MSCQQKEKRIEQQEVDKESFAIISKLVNHQDNRTNKKE